MHWLLLGEGITRSPAPYLFSRDAHGEIDGICRLGMQFILSAPCSPAALELFAFHEQTRSAEREVRAIVGTRREIDAWWELVRSRHRPLRARRVRQPLYVVRRESLRGSRADADVEPASLAEADELIREAAALIEQELEVRPNVADVGFRRRIEGLIREGRWWRWRVDGELRFQCNVGFHTPYTAQLQGVWTPLALRRRGYAQRALGAVCDRLLDDFPSVSLYVNDFNLSAVALYERLGLQKVAELSTLLF